MPRNNTMDSLALEGYDSIFGNTFGDNSGEHIKEILITDLHLPEFHPFQVIDDEAMTRLSRKH